MIEFSLRPNTVAMATARTKYGIDKKMSTMRMISESVRPPKNPEIAPNVTPISRASNVDRMPIFSETRAP